MCRIAYCCPFVPPELISACRLQPWPIIPRASCRVRGLTSVAGVCPYARAFVGEVLGETKLRGVILTTRCDQMRRAADLLSEAKQLPVFLLNVPRTWQSQFAQALYRSELARLARFLAEFSSHMPSDDDLAESVLAYADRRQLQDHTAHAGVVGGSGTTMGGHSSNGIPVALAGGPLLWDHFALFDVVSDFGGRIVINATESGDRSLPGRIDESRLSSSPLSALAHMYFDVIPDVFQRPGTRLLDWLEGRMRERQVRGLIVHRYVWCDLWHAEVGRFRSRFDLPLLDLDSGDEDGPNTARMTTRVQAFLEALQ